jgi:hypothetical protein
LKIQRTAIVLGFSLVSVLFSSAAFGQTAAEIADRNIAARGGVDNFRAIHTLKLTGQIGFGGQATGPLTVLVKAPSSFYSQFTAAGGKYTQGYDGNVGWQISPASPDGSPAILAGELLAAMQDQAVNGIAGPLFDHVARGNTLELSGNQTIDGKPCFRLKVTLRTGSLIYMYIDKSTFLEVREELPRTFNGKEQLIAETVGDYRKFGNMLFPCSFVSTIGGQPGENLQVENMEINPAIEDAVFHMPLAAPAPPSNPAPTPPLKP